MLNWSHCQQFLSWQVLDMLWQEAVVQRCSLKIGVLRNLAKFTRKHLCQSLFFNKVTGAEISQNSQENTCVRVSFLMKLQA